MADSQISHQITTKYPACCNPVQTCAPVRLQRSTEVEIGIGWGGSPGSLIGYFSVSHVLALFYFSGDRWQCCYNVKRNLQRNWIFFLTRLEIFSSAEQLQSSSRIRNISEMIEPILGLFPLEDKLWIALARYNGYHKKPTIYWSSGLKTWQAGCHGTLDFRQDCLPGRM